MKAIFINIVYKFLTKQVLFKKINKIKVNYKILINSTLRTYKKNVYQEIKKLKSKTSKKFEVYFLKSFAANSNSKYQSFPNFLINASFTNL